MDAPRTGIWEIEDGKIKTFDCYPEGTIIFAQLGVLANLQARSRQSAAPRATAEHEPGARVFPAAACG